MNMTFKAAICDDDEKENSIIKSYLHSLELEQDMDFEISVFTNGNTLLSQYRKADAFHILFLDVEMPEINGLEVARQIRNLPDKQVKIVFISNYPEYMQDSFNVQAFHYLAKPLQYDTFKQLMYRIIKDYRDSHISKLLIQEDGIEELVYLDDILYIEAVKSQKSQLNFVLTNKTINARGTIYNWEEELKSHYFISPYRGLLVNINHVHFIQDSSLILSNGETIPLSRRKEKDIRTLFNKHVLTLTS